MKQSNGHTFFSDSRVAAFLLFALFAALPLAWGKLLFTQMPLFGEVPGVDFSVFALLSLAAICAGLPGLRRLAGEDSGCRIFLAAAGFGVLLVLLQQIAYGWSLTLFLSSLFYFAAPVAGLLLTREIRRKLPCFLLILFFGCLLISLREWTAGLPALGLAGNWNWNWTLLAVSAPSLAFLFPPRFRLAAAAVAVLCVAGGQFFVTPGHSSRGTLVGCVIAAIFLFIAPRLRNRAGKRKAILIAATAVVAVAAVAGYLLLRSGTLSSAVPQENRLGLWQGTVALGERHWLFGTGPGRFEGEIAPSLPLSYHDSDFAADRHPHPHNELLFYWCGFGLFGVLWWGIGTALGMRGILRRRRGDELTLLAAWAWLVLLIHGQVDVILHTPLAGGLFLLLTGTLAAGGVRRVRVSGQRRPPVLFLLFGGAAALLLCLNLASGWNCRAGKLALLAGDPETARQRLNRSAALLPTPENLYTLGTVELFDFRDPVAAAKSFERISAECRLPSCSHSAGRTARALAAAGMPRESLPYFEQEQRNFPRGAVNLRLWESVARALGDTATADRLLAEWRELLTHKGIDETLFPHLLRNQHLDDSPQALKLFLEEVRR